MEKRKLTITVAGNAGSGKSHLLHLLKGFLRDNGFDVSHNVSYDFNSEIGFDWCVDTNYNDAIEAIRKNTAITIKEIQTAVEPKK
jgi:ABC-type polysaccharide/polyol phosphate transport system ATPase subunit